MKRIFDVQLPFFIPLWRRIALVIFTGAWALLEWSWGNQLWSVGFGALTVYLAHQFFLDFDPKDPDTPD